MIVTAVMQEIDFAPSTTAEEVVQNIRTILATPKFSVPLDRDFGVDWSILDRPLPLAKAKYTAEIITAIKKYEPRATVSSVSFTATEDGVLLPVVEVTINE